MATEQIKTCPICGAPTRVYMGHARKDGLCGTHADMFKNGEIIQCEKCGSWHKAGQKCKCENSNTNTQTGVCIICGKQTQNANFKQCQECFEESMDFCGSIDRSRNSHAFRDHYYNLRDSISIMKDISITRKNCNKLIALAILNSKINDDDSLKARVYQDVEKLIESKKKIPVPSKEVEEERKEKDAEKERSHTTMDGHSVKSDMEVRIDDILYMNRIIHCYEKPIDEIAEKRKKCDWFIPITANKGIYIEYWGMDTPEYKKARAEKEELYRTNNIPYISIEKDEPKNDTQIFSSNLIRDITKLAKERYKFMPEWS